MTANTNDNVDDDGYSSDYHPTTSSASPRIVTSGRADQSAAKTTTATASGPSPLNPLLLEGQWQSIMKTLATLGAGAGAGVKKAGIEAEAETGAIYNNDGASTSQARVNPQALPPPPSQLPTLPRLPSTATATPISPAAMTTSDMSAAQLEETLQLLEQQHSQAQLLMQQQLKQTRQQLEETRQREKWQTEYQHLTGVLAQTNQELEAKIASRTLAQTQLAQTLAEITTTLEKLGPLATLSG